MVLSNLNFNRIFVFYEVYRSRSIQLAAQKLSITPSAVSQQLKKLEDEINASLFERTTRHIVPTEPGNKLFACIEGFMKELPLALQTLQAAKAQLSGRLRIAAPGILGSTALVDQISLFRRKYPLVGFDLQQRNNPSEAIEDLFANRCDMAIVDLYDFMEKQYSISVRPLVSEEEWMVGSKEYFEKRLGKSRSYEAIASQTFVTSLPSGLAEKLWIQRAYDKTPYDLDIGLSSENLRGMIEAVKKGIGLALIPAYLIKAHVRSGELKVISTPGLRYVNKMGMIRLTGNASSPALATFMDFLEGQFRKRGGQL